MIRLMVKTYLTVLGFSALIILLCYGQPSYSQSLLPPPPGSLDGKVEVVNMDGSMETMTFPAELPDNGVMDANIAPSAAPAIPQTIDAPKTVQKPSAGPAASNLQSFPYENLEAEVRAAVADKLGAQDFTLDQVIIAPQNGNKIVPLNRMAELKFDNQFYLASISMNEKAGRFNAVLASDNGGVEPMIEIRGRYTETVKVPTLSSRLEYGQVIAGNDIHMLDVPKRHVKPDTILQAEELIGKTSRRLIAENKPIRAGDITLPNTIQRGQMVTLYYRTAGMELKTTGIAAENGALNQLVRFKNPKSNVVVQAKIISPDEAIVNYGNAPAQLASR